MRADEDGIHVGSRLAGSFDVLFDGEPVWSFTVEPERLWGRRLIRWPNAMRAWLHGTAHISLRPSVAEGGAAAAVDLGRVSFDGGREPIEFVDGAGRPVVIDKWGIVQRPFETRGNSVTAELAARTQQVIDVVREECGLETWMSFGTLLGAAREGKAIGHDSDVDLLYLSEHQSPALVNLESYRIKRSLTRRGIKSVVKSGSFVTVLFTASDGAPLGIDIYACFYVGDLLHETATVRAPIPREAVLPLTTLEFEGVALPAPADPATLLEASYGPNWRVPDPSFRHTPGPEITDRFDGWFGSSMTHRRAWELWWNERREVRPVSTIAQRLLADLAGTSTVVELGAGNGSDALHMAVAGHRIQACEYARFSFKQANAEAVERGVSLRFRQLNLYDLRDVLTAVALFRHRRAKPKAVLARGLLDSLHPRAWDHVWRFLRLALRGGGRAYLEFDEPEGLHELSYVPAEGPIRYAITVDHVRAEVERHGGRVLDVASMGREKASRGVPALTRWQLVAEWP